MPRTTLVYRYAFLLQLAETGGYVVTCRDLPELLAQGKDRQHALIEANGAVEEALLNRLLQGDSWPLPTKARPGEVMAAMSAEVLARTDTAPRHENMGRPPMACPDGV